MNHVPPPADPGFSDSDQQWFDALTGQTAQTQADDSGAAREAAKLRRVFELGDAAAANDPDHIAALTPQAHDRSWQQLQFRQRQADASRAATAPWWRRGRALTALAASVLVAVVLVNRPGDEHGVYDPRPVYRGDLEVVQLRSTQPRADAEALAQALKGAGLPAAIYQDGKAFTIDAVVEADTPAAAVERLRQAGAKAEPGLNRIEFAPR